MSCPSYFYVVGSQASVSETGRNAFLFGQPFGLGGQSALGVVLGVGRGYKAGCNATA